MEKGNTEKNQKARVWIDLIEEFMANEMTNLSVERKFNLKNKFGPKKMPERVISRASLTHIYSWIHYAP